MAVDYLLPKLAMSMNEGTINQWLVKQGEQVKKGQAVLELETDKVTQEIESPETGYFSIVAQEGETLKVNTLIAQICESKEELVALNAPSSSSTIITKQPSIDDVSSDTQKTTRDITTVDGSQSFDRIIASPLARKIARDHQINLALLSGTGPNGRIIKQDVLAVLERVASPPAPSVANATGAIEKIRIPIKGLRQTIANNMIASLQNTAQLSSVWESDITDLLAMREKIAKREDQFNTKVSVNAFVLKAICYAVKQVPIANACLQDGDLVIYDTINIGIAVSVPGNTEFDSGLIVPVLNNVGQMGLVDIDLAMKALIHRARNNALSPEELSGSTLTMTSTAGLAPPGCQSTPILNLPNAVIINPSTPTKKPVVRKGEVVARTMMPVSLTFDHCLLDGEPAVRFASALHDCLEHPELILA